MDNKKIAYALSRTETPLNNNVYPSITRLVMYQKRSGEGFDSYIMIGVASEKGNLKHLGKIFYGEHINNCFSNI